ncbi:MAG: hypothetical protein M3R50_08865 [Bacteroidota bacterium]|nr:hypothetical protein [Bacteroidota bacterium]
MKIFSSKKLSLIIFILSVPAISLTTFVNPPEATITNGLIHAHLYLPDAEDGYYRGSRFDWSGVISGLEYKGHEFYGQWFPKYAPTIHDAIMGPVEDFLPVGYEDAKPGENFLKIGIGMLMRPDTSRYSIVPPYKIINPGTWDVKTKRNKVEFVHILNDTFYSYQYKKTVELAKGKPELILSHTLKNTGKKVIETIVYDHNFLTLDKKTTGPGFTVTFPFNLTGEGGNEELATIKGNEIIFQNELVKNEHVYYTVLNGYGDSAKDYDIKVENKNTGIGVRITSDRPLSKLAFWSISTTVCPEPFIKINIKPGEEFSWKIVYDYYVLNP